jgi:hypothetical protein
MLLVSGIALAQQVTVSRDSTLHATPSTDAAGVAQLKQGTTAEVIGRQGAWVNVKTSAGSGWIYSFNVTYPSGGGPAASGGSRRPAPITPTAGIRGLEKEEMKNAQFDGKQLDALDSFAGEGGSGAGEKPRGKK